MDKTYALLLRGFYENELKNRFLSYWLPRCEDEAGGFVNCFTNDGKTLVSRDKYCWSQGRFVWFFSRLASTKAPIFSGEERKEFLRLAGQGAAFLKKHALLPGEPMRCAFLLDAEGTPKLPDGCDVLDASIYADCFVVAGLAGYAAVSGEEESFRFALALYRSIRERLASGEFHTLPYPLSGAYRSHGIPMILENVAAEVYQAAVRFDPGAAEELLADTAAYTEEVLADFCDDEYRVREIIRKDGSKLDKLLGSHINPGHTLEDVWFMLDSMRLTGRTERREQVFRVAEKAFELGWDEELGGILHFAGLTGGRPEGDNAGLEDEPMSKQLETWGSKLWWVHSEALYTALRCHKESGSDAFLAWHDKVFAYTYKTFPNPDLSVGEWIQIRDRDGSPQNKVVALPVKDPYHVIRDLILILELLYED